MILVALIAGVCFSVSSCGPDLSKLRLSDCMDACNATTKLCLNEAEARDEACSEFDIDCQKKSIKDSEKCLTDALSCVGTCTHEAETTLKN